MDRTYSSNTAKDVKFFIGKEIENTAFKGLDTLFVVGNRTSVEILNKIKQVLLGHTIIIAHIYFAANHSYNTFEQFEQIQEFLDYGYKVTYETTNDRINKELLTYLPTTNRNFVFMVSVVIPEIENLIERTVIKFDDNDINRTNPGVWCFPLINLLEGDSSHGFTGWDEYRNDIILD